MTVFGAFFLKSSDKCIYLNPVGKEKRRYNQTHTVTLCCSIDKNTFFTYYVQSIEVLATTNEHPLGSQTLPHIDGPGT